MGVNSEEKLVKAAIRKETSALEALYDRYAPRLLSLCIRYCGNPIDAEDILHDGFIKIICHLPSFKINSRGSFEGWMKRIMVNTALNHIRDRAKEKNLLKPDPTEELFVHPALADEPIEKDYFTIDQEKIMEMICELPMGYRTVFNLYVFEQYTHKEIGKLLKISENTSKSQLSKARALLRKKLDKIMKIKHSV